MSLLSRLFGGGGGSGPKTEPESYKGFNIFAEPIKEASGYRVSARIEKDVDGETRSHTLIRADVISDAEQAREISANKAKILIDEKGDRVFD